MSILDSAQKLDKSEIPSIFRLETLTASGTNDGSFLLLVPKDWQLADIAAETIASGRMSPIAIFEANKTSGVSLQVQATILGNEISAAHWLQGYLISKNWKISEMHSRTPRNSSAEFEFHINNVPFLGIATAFVRSNELYLLQGIAPKEIMDHVAPFLAVSVRSFDPQKKLERNLIEELVAHEFAQQLAVTMPESWESSDAVSAPSGKFAKDFQRLDEDGILLGWLRVKSVDKGLQISKNILLSDMLDEMKSNNILVDGIVDEKNISVDEPFISALRLQYKAEITDGASLSMLVMFIEVPKSFIIVSIVGPSEDVDYFEWAINIRAWEICFTTLRLLPNDR